MDQSVNHENEVPNWYEEFLSDFDYQSPKPGQILEGKIIRIDEDAMLVDVGLKRDALISAKDLSQLDEEKVSALGVGETVSVYVLEQAVGDRELQVSLTRGIEHQSWERAEKLLELGDTLELEIIGYNRGGLIVRFETLRGFLPYSLVPEIQGVRSQKLAEKLKSEMVGSTMEMKVIEVARQRNRLIFSAAAALTEKRKQRLTELEKGQILHGLVVSIVDFGIFVNLDGIDGLVHISQLDWKKIKHPSEIAKVGDEMDVKVIDVNIERERVSLSRKAVLPSPWDLIAESIKPGDYIEGRVTRVVNFGAFMELASGVEGLVHISQLGYSAAQNPQDAVKPNDIVLLRVLDVDHERKRIALSMRQVSLERQIAWAMENLEDENSIAPQKPDAEKIQPPAMESTDEGTEY